MDLDKLEEMHKLVEKGVLTQEEFNKKKEEML
ncbi:SHOCT domain-containing protein [Companilactobacillus sp.]